MNIAITGANSGVGHILLRHVAASDDIRAVACVRSTQAAAALPASPRIVPRAIDYDARDGLASALAGTSCVVHLAGILFESPTSSYQTANVEATRAVVEACKQADVTRLVLVSVLGADPQSTNRYWRSKGQAEQIVSGSGLAGAILRTPILLGPGMAGSKALAHQSSQPSVMLLGGGRHSIRPLDVDDLSRAILRCCAMPDPGVRVYELVGPEPVTYRDVVERTAALAGRTVAIRSAPVWLARLGAAIAGWRQRGGMTPTVIDVITSNEHVHENAAAALGITLTPLASTLQKILPAGSKGQQP